ncbi:MAG: molybdenum cofactor guanylyltransferase [Promethearchaeota archaeon]
MLKINDKSKEIAFAVLVGGKSTRFGTDKGLFLFKGRPLISYLLDTLSNEINDIFIIAHSPNQVQNYVDNIDIKKIIAFILDDKKLVPDLKLHAPLLGLYSAYKELSALGYKRTFTLSCDTPLIKYEVIKFIIDQSKGVDCCIPRWNNGYLEPLLAIYPTKRAYFRAKEKILRKEFQLTSFADNQWRINYLSIENSIKPIDEDLVSFININTRDDLKSLKKK